MPDRDIVDAIDELVDWQMSNYENRSGYDRNVNQVDCPHSWCREPWHGLAITRRMQEMRWGGQVDPAYRYADDDSDVLCPGSEFDGEFVPPVDPRTGYDSGGVLPGIEFPRAYTEAFSRLSNPAASWMSWQLPDDPFNPNEWLARGPAQWWRCDQPDTLNGVEVTWQRDVRDYAGWPGPSLMGVQLTVRIGGAVVDVRPSPGDGTQYRIGVDPETNRLQWIEVHSTHRPTVGEWQPLDPPQPAIQVQPTVRLWREEDGWQELGTLAEPVQFQPSPEIEDPALAFTPEGRTFTATFDIANVDAACNRLYGGSEPADTPGDQAA